MLPRYLGKGIKVAAWVQEERVPNEALQMRKDG